MVKAIDEKFELVRLKNKFASWERKQNESGHKFEFPNIHINAVFRAKESCAPIIVEIQVHHKEVMRLGGKDHTLYEIKRAKSIKDLL